MDNLDARAGRTPQAEDGIVIVHRKATKRVAVLLAHIIDRSLIHANHSPPRPVDAVFGYAIVDRDLAVGTTLHQVIVRASGAQISVPQAQVTDPGHLIVLKSALFLQGNGISPESPGRVSGHILYLAAIAQIAHRVIEHALALDRLDDLDAGAWRRDGHIIGRRAVGLGPISVRPASSGRDLCPLSPRGLFPGFG